MSYANRYSRPLGVDGRGWGGAGANLGIEALAGDTDMVTVFDDFNIYVDVRDLATATAGGIEDNGFTVTQVGGAAAGSGVGINDDATAFWDSCLRINCGTDNDQGGNIQLIPAAGETHFPHIWIPDSGTATSLDNTVIVFAVRVGVNTTDAAGDFDGKAFIGFAAAGETAVMTAATGALSVAAAADILLGFHLGCNGEVGAIDGISQRVGNTAYAEGTNFTRMLPAGSLDAVAANGATAVTDTVWYDLALRCTVTDMSDANANGATEFFWRRVPQLTNAPGLAAATNLPGQDLAWVRHPTVLLNQTPNSGTNLVPTIECINGPADDSDFLIDWWAFGYSRYSRSGR